MYYSELSRIARQRRDGIAAAAAVVAATVLIIIVSNPVTVVVRARLAGASRSEPLSDTEHIVWASRAQTGAACTVSNRK